jgi:YVTN family beta-propeller protein
LGHSAPPARCANRTDAAGSSAAPQIAQFSSDGAKLFVTTGRGKKVFVVDTATNKVDTSVEVGDRPWGIGLSPDGKFLYTANGPSNDVSVVDLATNAVVKKIKVGDKPWGIVIVGN